jgi:hypothetical protein
VRGGKRVEDGCEGAVEKRRIQSQNNSESKKKRKEESYLQRRLLESHHLSWMNTRYFICRFPHMGRDQSLRTLVGSWLGVKLPEKEKRIGHRPSDGGFPSTFLATLMVCLRLFARLQKNKTRRQSHHVIDEGGGKKPALSERLPSKMIMGSRPV